MRANVRFKYWMFATLATLVLLLAGLFINTAFDEFARLAEEDAKQRFALIAQRAADEVGALTRGIGRSTDMLSRLPGASFARDGRLNDGDLVPALSALLDDSPAIYSVFFALGDGSMVQVIGVRGDARLAATLGAPSATQLALRRIDRQPGERWQFLGNGGVGLGEKRVSTRLVATTRAWYRAAQSSGALSITAPYVFASSGEPGLTLSAPLPRRLGVFGIDINLGAIKRFLSGLSLTPNAALLVLDEHDRILAFDGRGAAYADLSIEPLTALGAVDHPLFRSLGAHDIGSVPAIVALEGAAGKQPFVVSRQTTAAVAGSHLRVVALAPMSDFTAPVALARRDVLRVCAAILLLLVPLCVLVARRVGAPLAQLARNSEQIKRFDFVTPPVKPASLLYEINALSDAQLAMHQALKERTAEHELARRKLERLVENGLLLSSERDRHKLLRHILFGSREIAQCAACTLFLKTEHDTLSFAMRTHDDPLPVSEVPLHDPETGAPMECYVSSYAALNNTSVVIDDVYRETRFDLSGTKDFSERSGFRTVSMLTVPLSPRSDEVIGVLQLMNALDPETGEVIPFPAEFVRYVEALAAQSAVALENHMLLAAQQDLMDSMIKMLAGAIDAKSAYTGNHCKRVPELAVMLAEEAGRVSSGALADFAFQSEDEWREFRVGAWLHDCGKITTPEHVIDKATKLETINNRIHEVRTRFEVLRRDARIAQLEALAAGADPTQAQAAYQARCRQLDEDFAFIAECNIGGEAMAPQRIERLQRIAAQTWLRHFDDRLGISSHEERLRGACDATTTLPVAEPLLADKPWHIVPRTDLRTQDPKYGFMIKVPEHLYNFGELHNLVIERGTLSAEERFKVNEHIIQTIIMLESMPFPKNLRRVPEYAGEHHETLLGGGYPRMKTPEQLSIPSRIMAIADIFEALTSSDRPYKSVKTLSESVAILAQFKRRGHIDADLFDLFLSSGVYRRFAENYLLPEQIDEVDITPYLGSASPERPRDDDIPKEDACAPLSWH